MRRFFALAGLLAVAAAAPARMYQWVDPDTHTPQLSGKPPTWYRSAEDGPRVFVIENGKVIDDTKVPVSEATRQQLRQNALLEVERDREAARQKMLEAERLKAAMGEAEQTDEQPAAAVAAPAPAQAAPEPEAAPGAGPTQEEMRALIEQWEKMRTQGAKQVVEGAPSQ